ncbi:hypothetical protein [Gloeobacter kilaueensis]|uniref:Uncharacterized protein n=1 Tax=Gloeobacter kilaueensis (strain ATCC BAA-2537 / CCAP 1431/1 / ULC 316 / JS1) TaxID=1183438 RepID=U5QFC6_GLOK1|nr:hypothetical protein [Gloeobacter kilaueensis]AGY57646.1 hypothetical protein GKIL_1400 [Gloeobacter kilaueensis JS1]
MYHAAAERLLALILSPHLADPTSATEWLQHFPGVMVVVKPGDKQIGWTATDDAEMVQNMFAAYSAPAYVAARQQLGITQLWICQIDLQYLPSAGEILEGSL